MSRPLRLFRLASWIALAAFHGWMLWERLADASILEPAVLLRWAGALALLGGVIAYQRWAPPSLRGRRALLVFWLLAAVLHVGAPAELDDANLALALLIPAIAILAVATTTETLQASSRFFAPAPAFAMSRTSHRRPDLRGPPRR